MQKPLMAMSSLLLGNEPECVVGVGAEYRAYEEQEPRPDRSRTCRSPISVAVAGRRMAAACALPRAAADNHPQNPVNFSGEGSEPTAR